MRVSPIVSAARTKLLWYFRFTNSFDIPGYVWNLCLFFLCFLELRWASHEQADWQMTLQCTQFHSFLSFAIIWCRAFWLSLSWSFSVSSSSSFGGRSGGIDDAVDGWTKAGIWTFCVCADGGGIATGTGIGLYLFALSTCFSLVTWSSQSSGDFDKYPQMMQFKSMDRDRTKWFNWFLCFLQIEILNLQRLNCCLSFMKWKFA